MTFKTCPTVSGSRKAGGDGAGLAVVSRERGWTKALDKDAFHREGSNSRGPYVCEKPVTSSLVPNPQPLPRNKPVLIYWTDRDGKGAVVLTVGM